MKKPNLDTPVCNLSLPTYGKLRKRVVFNSGPAALKCSNSHLGGCKFGQCIFNARNCYILCIMEDLRNYVDGPFICRLKRCNFEQWLN